MEHDTKNIKFDRKRLVALCCLCLCLVVFGFSVFQIVHYYTENVEQQAVVDQIKQEGIRPADPPANVPLVDENGNEIDLSKLYPDIQVDFSALQKDYVDVTAWIYCKDTKIHYPVVHTTDNNYYLYRLPNGETNNSGSIFMDCRNDWDYTGWNYLLYGHNMKNGTMFGTVMDYRDQKFFEEHPVMFYFTPDQTYRLEIFAGVHTTSTSYIYSTPYTRTEQQQYLDQIFSQNSLQSDIEVSIDDQIMILSTCSGAVNSTQRYVLVAKMVPLYPTEEEF